MDRPLQVNDSNLTEIITFNLSDINFNSLTTSGLFYNVLSGSGYNAPINSAETWYVIISRGNNDEISQEAFAHSNMRKFIRKKLLGTWQAWEEILTPTSISLEIPLYNKTISNPTLTTFVYNSTPIYIRNQFNKSFSKIPFSPYGTHSKTIALNCKIQTGLSNSTSITQGINTGRILLFAPTNAGASQYYVFNPVTRGLTTFSTNSRRANPNLITFDGKTIFNTCSDGNYINIMTEPFTSCSTLTITTGYTLVAPYFWDILATNDAVYYFINAGGNGNRLCKATNKATCNPAIVTASLGSFNGDMRLVCDGTYLYHMDYAKTSIQKTDCSTLTYVSPLSLTSYFTQIYKLLYYDGYIFVCGVNSGTYILLRVRVSDFTVVDQITLTGITSVFSPYSLINDEKYIYVHCNTTSVAKIDISTFSIVGVFDLPSATGMRCLFTDDKYIYSGRNGTDAYFYRFMSL